MDIRIEKMKEQDLPQVIEIEHRSFPTPFSEKLFRTELNFRVANLYAVKRGDEVVGYVDFWIVADEAHVITIAVKPECRKDGIGTKLIQFMIDEAKRKGVQLICLDVRPTNGAALKLYEKFGFGQTSVRKRYYQDNDEDAIVMTLHLPLPPDDGQAKL